MAQVLWDTLGLFPHTPHCSDSERLSFDWATRLGGIGGSTEVTGHGGTAVDGKTEFRPW